MSAAAIFPGVARFSLPFPLPFAVTFHVVVSAAIPFPASLPVVPLPRPVSAPLLPFPVAVPGARSGSNPAATRLRTIRLRLDTMQGILQRAYQDFTSIIVSNFALFNKRDGSDQGFNGAGVFTSASVLYSPGYSAARDRLVSLKDLVKFGFADLWACGSRVVSVVGGTCRRVIRGC